MHTHHRKQMLLPRRSLIHFFAARYLIPSLLPCVRACVRYLLRVLLLVCGVVFQASGLASNGIITERTVPTIPFPFTHLFSYPYVIRHLLIFAYTVMSAEFSTVKGV